jgi:hypothetical protein
MSENHQPKHDALEEAIAAFQRMTVPDRPPDTEMLARLGTVAADSARLVSVPIPPKRRYLMRLLVPSAAVAASLLAGLTLFVLNSTPTFALGDAVKAAEKHKLVKYKQKETTTNEQGQTATTDYEVFADLKASRFRKESRHRFADPDDMEKLIEEVHVDVTDFANARHLMSHTHPGGKFLPPRKDAFLGPTEKNNFKSFIDSLREFQQKKGVTSGKDTLGGRETIRFRFEDEEQLKDGSLTTTLWVDAKTKLPVRLDHKLSFKTQTVQLVGTDFEWDPDLPKGFKNVDELFSTRPPPGYTLDDQTKNEK